MADVVKDSHPCLGCLAVAPVNTFFCIFILSTPPFPSMPNFWSPMRTNFILSFDVGNLDLWSQKAIPASARCALHKLPVHTCLVLEGEVLLFLLCLLFVARALSPGCEGIFGQNLHVLICIFNLTLTLSNRTENVVPQTTSPMGTAPDLSLRSLSVVPPAWAKHSIRTRLCSSNPNLTVHHMQHQKINLGVVYLINMMKLIRCD